MTAYEYRVIPAPKRGVKAKGAKTAEDRFAVALAEVMNVQGAEGWDYVRSDMLPCEERQGLTGKATVYHTLLVFRRAIATAQQAEPPAASLPSPAAVPQIAVAAPRAVDAPLNPAPPLGPAERLAAE
jgi:hypothetical protein